MTYLGEVRTLRFENFTQISLVSHEFLRSPSNIHDSISQISHLRTLIGN
jgi:hypothetical protein